jgi:hypothetical protein
MAVIKSEVQAAVALNPGTAVLNSLGIGTYAVTGSINHSINDPLDVLIDVSFTTGTSSTGNKQVIVFCQASPDGTNWTSGPTALTTATDEANLYFVGTIPANSANTTYRKIFNLAAVYGGTLPLYSRIIFKNDTGAVLASSGSAVTASEVWGVAL